MNLIEILTFPFPTTHAASLTLLIGFSLSCILFLQILRRYRILDRMTAQFWTANHVGAIALIFWICAHVPEIKSTMPLFESIILLGGIHLALCLFSPAPVFAIAFTTREVRAHNARSRVMLVGCSEHGASVVSKHQPASDQLPSDSKRFWKFVNGTAIIASIIVWSAHFAYHADKWDKDPFLRLTAYQLSKVVISIDYMTGLQGKMCE